MKGWDASNAAGGPPGPVAKEVAAEPLVLSGEEPAGHRDSPATQDAAAERAARIEVDRTWITDHFQVAGQRDDGNIVSIRRDSGAWAMFTVYQHWDPETQTAANELDPQVQPDADGAAGAEASQLPDGGRVIAGYQADQQRVHEVRDSWAATEQAGLPPVLARATVITAADAGETGLRAVTRAEAFAGLTDGNRDAALGVFAGNLVRCIRGVLEPIAADPPVRRTDTRITGVHAEHGATGAGAAAEAEHRGRIAGLDAIDSALHAIVAADKQLAADDRNHGRLLADLVIKRATGVTGCGDFVEGGWIGVVNALTVARNIAEGRTRPPHDNAGAG